MSSREDMGTFQKMTETENDSSQKIYFEINNDF